MDLATLFIGLFILLAFVIPFVIMTRFSKEKRLLSLYKKKCREHKLNISKEEILPGRIIGLDADNKMLLFAYQNTDSEKSLLINLNTVSRCMIHQKVRSPLAGMSMNQKLTEEVNLRLTFQEEGQEDLFIPFYDGSRDEKTNFKLHHQKAEKWIELINHCRKE